MMMRRETPKVPKLRLDLLLYTMGAEALAKYLKTTKVATRRWKLGINDNPANATNAIGWGTLDQPHDEHHNGSQRGDRGRGGGGEWRGVRELRRTSIEWDRGGGMGELQGENPGTRLGPRIPSCTRPMWTLSPFHV